MAITDLSKIVRGDATIPELVEQMEKMGAGTAQFVKSQQGQPTAAIVLIHGPDTQSILNAIEQRDRDLDMLRNQVH